MMLWGPPRAFLSPFGGTLQTLSFFRDVPGQDPVTMEERANFAPFAQYVCDVQPKDATTLFNTRLASLYVQMFTIVIDGMPDVRPNDRVVIAQAECIVESVNQWGGHMELLVGARQPPQG